MGGRLCCIRKRTISSSAGPGWNTIVGFGSLWSEESARSSFPSLTNFRLGKLRGWKRVFAHPAAIFFERGIARLESREFASLSIEQSKDDESFMVTLFEIKDQDMPEFYEREEEFNVRKIKVLEVSGDMKGSSVDAFACTRGTDAEYIDRWGEQRFKNKYIDNGVSSIWGIAEDIYPCRVYLRHCVLAVSKRGEDIRNDFLDNTYLSVYRNM